MKSLSKILGYLSTIDISKSEAVNYIIFNDRELRTTNKVPKMKAAAFLVLFLLGYGNCSNILVMMPFPMYSHTQSYMPIFTELANRGHNVTMVSPFPQENPIPNFNEIIIENVWEKRMREDNFNVRMYDLYFTKLVGPWVACPTMLNEAMNSTLLKNFLSDTSSKFDMVITETFFCQEPFIALGHKYGAIQVSVQSITLFMSLSLMTGNPHNPSYVPNSNLALSQHMNFWERSKNTLANIFEHFVVRVGWTYMDYAMRTKLGKFPGFENLPPLVDMIRNISLILIDNHNSLIYPRPYLPNVIEFGSLTVWKEDKIPENVEKFMNESEHGIVYFSWGSHYKTTNMAPGSIEALMSAFGKLKQRVLMKADQETIPGKPNNVLLAQWLPQASILAHPKTRVFISHGGLHGFSEAVYYGVPILGTPLFADQDFNLKVAEQAGFSINVEFEGVTEKGILDALNKLLTDPSYKENALKRSAIMKDRPINGLDNAVYWVEYMLRHKGAPHLKSAAVELYWFQYFLLDVIVVWGALTAITIAILYKSFKTIYDLKIFGTVSKKLKTQ